MEVFVVKSLIDSRYGQTIAVASSMKRAYEIGDEECWVEHLNRGLFDVKRFEVEE